MVSTAYVEFTAGVRGIGARTNSAGAAVGDLTAEEDRLVQAIFTEGAITTDAFKVTTNAGMAVKVGTTANVDLYTVAGDVVGQGQYLVRLNSAPVSVTLLPADPSQARIDQLYLVVADNAYDASARALPRIGRRSGDPGGAAPGPDPTWKASALLATITVPAGAASIVAGNIADARTTGSLQPLLDHDASASAHPLLRTSLFGASARTVPPYARIRSGPVQAYLNDSADVTSMTVLEEETDATFGDTANSRLVVPVAGLYLITGVGEWDNLMYPAETFETYLTVVAGGTFYRSENTVVMFGSQLTIHNVTTLARCSAGSTIRLSAFQGSSATVNLERASLSALWLAP